jgi:deoxyribonuclease IV
MNKKSTNRIGAHVSIAGGVQNAPIRAQEEGCETFQCFTRSPQGGPAPILTNQIVATFKENMASAGIDRWYIHAPYYINLASLDNRIRHSSIRVIREELERGTTLGARYVMFHPGSYKDQTLQMATETVQKGLEGILDSYQGSCQLLIEISAGAGNVLGDTFEEIAGMIERCADHPGFGGICFDTCHAFASGYDYRTPEGAREMLNSFQKNIGLQWLKLSHVQDSKTDVGGKRDRHEHIGRGYVGTDGLETLLKTPEFSEIDWILETESGGRSADIAILKEIRSK